MPVINPPKIDRAELHREAEERRFMEALAEQVRALLKPGERIARPYRAEGSIVLPVVQDKQADPDGIHALVTAWLDEAAAS